LQAAEHAMCSRPVRCGKNTKSRNYQLTFT
jgi:hypothetical protein